ncbi:hypothetical protein HYV10_00090 [Candidatus Dependentiae bacterium]|nr:hypothetical protein [Candidatus Dependentiae bacterium]
MSYKIIFSILFLMSFPIIGKGTNNERIQKLEEQITQKEQELSDLGTLIAQKDEQLLAIYSKGKELLRIFTAKRIMQLEKENNGKELSSEDEDIAAKEIEKETDEFLYKFWNGLKDNKPIVGMLTKGLFQGDGNLGIFDVEEFESLKFYFIQRIFDQLAIIRLVKKYEICITEYRTLINELADLQK